MAVLRAIRQRGERVNGNTPVASTAAERRAEMVRNAKKTTQGVDPNAYNIDRVSSAAPLTLNVEPAPVIETRSLVSQDPSQINPNLTPQPAQPKAPAIGADITAAGQGGTLKTELETQRKQLEDEITATQERLATLPASTLAAKDRLGINEDNKLLQTLRGDLNKVKQNLMASQDEEVAIGERGLQRISDFAGTAGDFGNLTGENLRQNRLDQLTQSRTLSRLGDTVGSIQASINDNVAIINEQAQAEQAKLEFDINQRNKILDRVIQTQGNILSAEQSQRLEDTKFGNSILLEQEKARLDMIQKSATNIASQGVAGGVLDRYISAENPEERDTLNNELYRSGEIDGKTFYANKAAIAQEAYDKEVQQQEAKAKGEAELKTAIYENRVKNLAGKAVIANADSMLSSINLLLDAHGNDELDNVLGAFDSSWFGQWTDKTKGLGAAIDHIFSDATVTALSQMKGNPSDKDMEVVEQMAKQGFDQTIDDPAKLAEILNAMKTGLEDAKLIESQGIRTRNSDVDAKIESLEELESLMEEQAAVPEGINFDKLVQVESGGKGYTALNQSSGAYGKYQVIPSTQQYYADKMGMSVEEARTPEGQEKVFAQITKDNIASLERNGTPINTVSVYLAHQQGAEGARQIASGKISPTVRRNLLANLPARYADMSDAEVIKGWGDVFIPQLT